MEPRYLSLFFIGQDWGGIATVIIHCLASILLVHRTFSPIEQNQDMHNIPGPIGKQRILLRIPFPVLEQRSACEQYGTTAVA